jgi:hypothetical protein
MWKETTAHTHHVRKEFLTWCDNVIMVTGIKGAEFSLTALAGLWNHLVYVAFK